MGGFRYAVRLAVFSNPPAPRLQPREKLPVGCG